MKTKKLMMYSPGDPFIMVAPVVTSWAVAGQRMVFLHMYLQTRVTLEAFPVATPRGRSSSSHEGELLIHEIRLHCFCFYMCIQKDITKDVTFFIVGGVFLP